MTGSSATKTFDPQSSLSIQVQSVLYNLPLENVVRALAYLDSAAHAARKAGLAGKVVVSYGDCSPAPTIGESEILDLQRRFANLSEIRYNHFNANLGSADGHNQLLKTAETDLVTILNPDVLASPTLFLELGRALGQSGVGLAEARQIPIEHPKEYDPETGETSWASTACAMGPTKLFHELNGFDADTFFLYCDDVDFSWRVRLAGYKVVHQCSAVVFHDKRLSHEGAWLASPAERYYSAEGTLLLTYKWSRQDLTEYYLRVFSSSGDGTLEKAASAFELRRKTGRLPIPVDPDHQVGQFIGGAYAHHRFVVR